MVTISHIVEKIVLDRPLLQEALIEDIVSFAALADKLHSDIENELRKNVKVSAIIMALRRHKEKLQENNQVSHLKIDSDIVMRTGLADFTIRKNEALFKKLEKVYNIVDYNKGDVLNIIHGNYETSIIISGKYKQKLLDLLKGVHIEQFEDNLVSLTLKTGRDFIHTPGILASLTRKLAWENINIYEIISTFTEVNIIVGEQDSVRCYLALQKMIASRKKGIQKSFGRKDL